MAHNKKKEIARKKAPTKRTSEPAQVVENVQGVGGATAERLRKAGYGTVAKLAQTRPDKLSEKSGLNKALAKKLILAAQKSSKEALPEQPSAKRITVAQSRQTLNGKIISKAMESEEFRRRVVRYIVDKVF